MRSFETLKWLVDHSRRSTKSVTYLQSPPQTPHVRAEMATQQQQHHQQQLLLQKSVFTAYLQPLLTKHEAAKEITYEDLTASWQAAMSAIAKARENSSTKPHASTVVRACVLREKKHSQHFGPRSCSCSSIHRADLLLTLFCNFCFPRNNDPQTIQ